MPPDDVDLGDGNLGLGRRSYDPHSYGEMLARVEHYEKAMRLRDLSRVELAALPRVLQDAVHDERQKARHARLLAVSTGVLATLESLVLIAAALGWLR